MICKSLIYEWNNRFLDNCCCISSYLATYVTSYVPKALFCNTLLLKGNVALARKLLEWTNSLNRVKRESSDEPKMTRINTLVLV